MSKYGYSSDGDDDSTYDSHDAGDAGQAMIVNGDFRVALIESLRDERNLEAYISIANDASLLMAVGDTAGANACVRSYLARVELKGGTLDDHLARQPNPTELLDTLRIMGVRLRRTAHKDLTTSSDPFARILSAFEDGATW